MLISFLLPCIARELFRRYCSLSAYGCQGATEVGGSRIFAGTAAPSRQPARISKTPMVRVPATASLLRAFQPRSSDSFHSVYSGLRPIYATQSHPQTLNPAHIQSLRDAKLRSGNAPAPKASGWPRAKPEPRSGRKGTRGSPNARSCLENRERSFHLSRNENHHFTLCLQGCGRFHARKIGEPPTVSVSK